MTQIQVDFYTQIGAQGQILSGQMLDANGDPINTTGADITLHLRHATQDDAIAYVTLTADGDPQNGRFTHVWQGDEVAEAGLYYGKIWITASDLAIPVPTSGAITVRVNHWESEQV